MRGTRLRRGILLAAAAGALVGAASALGAFGTGGKVIVNAGGTNSADGVAIGKNGAIVGAGAAVPGASGFDLAVVRVTSAGLPDASFSGDGEQTRDINGGFDVLDSVVVQKDGAILAGGSSDGIADQRRATLVRYEPDGDADPTFSGDGMKVYPFGGKATDVEDIALQADGKVVIAGSISGSGDGQDALVARVKPSGRLDKSFGKRGWIKFGVKKGTDLAAVALQRDGRIVVAGETSGIEMGDNGSQLYARITESGKLDRTFSRDGIFTRRESGASTRVEDVAIHRSGLILGAVGIFAGPDPAYGVSAVKESGRKARKFGKKGLAVRDFGDDTSLNAIAVQKAGGIVVGGGVRSGDIDFLVARFTRAGKLDESFGFKGATVTDFAGGSSDIVQDLAIGKDDVIVAAGIGDSDFGFARYLADGDIDD